MLRPALALAALLLIAPAPPTVHADEELPTAREILDRYVEETNATSLTELPMRKEIGSFAVPAQGLTGDMAVWRMAPNLFYSEIEVPGIGKIRSGYDGETAWSIDPMSGAQVLTDDSAKEVLRQANYYASLYREEDLESAEVVGLTQHEGADAYELSIVWSNGVASTDYFSVETGLWVGGAMEVATPMGSIEATLSVDRYEELGGMRVPTRVTTSVMGMQQVLLLDDVEFDEFEDTIFDLPKEIAAMAD